MRITPSRLSVLLAVHRAGGIVAAADSQHLTPSAVSQQIKLLEKEAGVRVLDRAPTGAVLTDAGRVLAETAERIEAELASAQRELATRVERDRGRALGGRSPEHAAGPGRR